MKKILIFNAHYYPGYAAGGIVRTIINTADWIGDKFHFFIVTKDRDLGDNKPYPNIPIDSWHDYGKSKIKYLPPHKLNFSELRRIINDLKPDFIHLNSYYDLTFTLKILILKRLNLINVDKIVMSPRGEFVEGPMRIKYFKKISYVLLTKLLGLHKQIIWHASLDLEASGISKVIGVAQKNVKIAIDLPLHPDSIPKLTIKPTKDFKVFFFSRITREKNLDGALKILMFVKEKISFDIVGFIEDPDYWSECESLIKKLPKNIKINVVGMIPSDEKLKILSSYDLLFFPSHGENFGHVIAESIAVGTRALLSKLPAWPDLHKDSIGWNFDLNQPKLFAKKIDELSRDKITNKNSLRKLVAQSARKRLFRLSGLDENINLYQ